MKSCVGLNSGAWVLQLCRETALVRFCGNAGACVSLKSKIAQSKSKFPSFYSFLTYIPQYECVSSLV